MLPDVVFVNWKSPKKEEKNITKGKIFPPFSPRAWWETGAWRHEPLYTFKRGGQVKREMEKTQSRTRAVCVRDCYRRVLGCYSFFFRSFPPSKREKMMMNSLYDFNVELNQLGHPSRSTLAGLRWKVSVLSGSLRLFLFFNFFLIIYRLILLFFNFPDAATHLELHTLFFSPS